MTGFSFVDQERLFEGFIVDVDRARFTAPNGELIDLSLIHI